jgi:aminopeptidase N
MVADYNDDHWAVVACEQLGESSWWPVKDHLSDEPDSMRIVLEVPDGYNAVSNGNLRNITDAGRGYDRFEWFVNHPVNNYNVTFYMGKYVSFDDYLVTPNDTVMLKLQCTAAKP